MAIDKVKNTMFILEFKRSTDREENFFETKKGEANEQHKSILQALKAAVPTGWEFEQISFVAGNRGYVIESDFYAKLKDLACRTNDKLLSDHDVKQICEEHDRVIRSFQQQIQRSSKLDIDGSGENMGQKVYA